MSDDGKTPLQASLRSTLRFGRRRADVHWTSCAVFLPSSAAWLNSYRKIDSAMRRCAVLAAKIRDTWPDRYENFRQRKKQPIPNDCFFLWRRYFLFLMGCNKKLYNVLGGVYGYYNTMSAQISVNKDEKYLRGFLYNMQRGPVGGFILV